MKANKTLPVSDGIPPAIREELLRTQPVTPERLATLSEANRKLIADPAFQADCCKGSFVESMLEALEERGETKAALADRWGKSRQYVQKIFDEDKRVNFTIDTLFELAHLLERRVSIDVLRDGESVRIIKTPISPRRIVNLDPEGFVKAEASTNRIITWLESFSAPLPAPNGRGGEKFGAVDAAKEFAA